MNTARRSLEAQMKVTYDWWKGYEWNHPYDQATSQQQSIHIANLEHRNNGPCN